MLQVKLNNVLMNADQVAIALGSLPLQDGPYRLDLVVLDDYRDRSYTIDVDGTVLNLGRNQGEHWIVCEYAFRSGDQSYPDAIAYQSDRLVSLYTLESWEVQALGYGDRLTIGVYEDDQGFVNCYYDEEKSAEEFADYVESQNPYDPDSDPDDD